MSRWIAGLDQPGEIRLVCLPHAGGGSRAYRPWQAALAPGIAVCPALLPGREGRWSEPAATRMAQLVEPLAEALAAADRRPLAIFGHSMGAAVGYALACRLAADPQAPTPIRLLVSGRPAPQLRPRLSPAHALPTPAFVQRLRSLNGTPSEVLAEQALLAALLPMLRADFAVNETYRPEPGTRLDVPVTAFGGIADPLAEPDELLAWREVTRGPFELRLFDGDHFYLNADPDPLLGAIRAALAPAVESQAALR